MATESTGFDAVVVACKRQAGFKIEWPGGKQVVNRIFASKTAAEVWLDGYYFAKDGG